MSLSGLGWRVKTSIECNTYYLILNPVNIINYSFFITHYK